MPSCVRSTLGARAPQWEGGCRRWDAGPRECRRSRQWCAGVGRPPTQPPPPPPPPTTSRVTHDWRCRLMPTGACTLENPALDYCPCWWLWWPFLSPAWFSPPSHGRAGCRQNELSALGPESGSSPLPSVGGVLELSSPSRHGRSKGPSYPGRRRTSKSKTVVPQRHEFESRCGSTQPGPSPVLGLATVVRDSPARPCSRWPRHLVRAWSGAWSMTTKTACVDDVAENAFHRVVYVTSPSRIDRWILRRSYCVCVWRLTSVCGRVSAAERLMWSIVRTAPYQSDGPRVLIV